MFFLLFLYFFIIPNDSLAISLDSSRSIISQTKQLDDNSTLISADHLIVKYKQNIAIFSENVKIDQNQTTIISPEAEVFYDNIKSPVGNGSIINGGIQIKKMIFNKGIKIINRKQTIEGKSAVYNYKDNKLVLLGVILREDKNVIAGEKLIYNLSTGQGVIFNKDKVTTKAILYDKS